MSEKNAQSYKDGYYAGKEAGWMDQISHNMEGFVPGPDSPYKDSYEAGWRDGLDDKYDDNNSHYSGGSTDSSDYNDSTCFITTACVKSKSLPDDCYELETLRKFRNDYVLKLKEGELLNQTYRKIGPMIIKNINNRSDSIIIYDNIYLKILDIINSINHENNETALILYKNMVNDLIDKLEIKI